MLSARGRPVLMSDVAQAANVSQSTVSRVLGGRSSVSAEVVARVNRAIEELGYSGGARRKPNRRAAASLALLVLDDNYRRQPDVFNAILGGIIAAANQSRATLTFLKSDDPVSIRKALKDAGAQAVLLSGFHMTGDIQRAIAPLPAVWISSYHDQDGDHVLGGNDLVGRMAADYLVNQRGHRRLAYLSHGNDYPAYAVRQQAFTALASSLGTPVTVVQPQGIPDADTVRKYHEEVERYAERLVAELLSSEPVPTGVFCPYDLLTAYVYRALAARHVQVGHDLEIISCNNEPGSLAGLSPRPATIDICAEVIGMHAVEQALWRIKYPDVRKKMVLVVEPELVTGEHLRESFHEERGG